MTKKNWADELAGAKWVSPLGASSALEAVTRHHRMFETFDLIANPLGKLSALEGMAMASVGIADQLAPIHKAYGATFLLAGPIGEHSKFVESMTAYTTTFEHAQRLTDMYSFHQTLFGGGAFFQLGRLADQMKNLCGAIKLPGEYDTIARLHESIGKTYGFTDAFRWAADLAAMTAPASSLLATGMFDRVTGVLSAFDDGGGSLAWLRHGVGDVPIFAAAALVKPVTATPSPRRFNVRCDVRCSICDDPMLVHTTDFHWESEDEVVVDLGIIPICAACTRRAQDDPAYWSEHLTHLRRPRFEVIDGGGEGDRKPAGLGILRAIEDHDETSE